jgi:hypothetical protein
MSDSSIFKVGKKMASISLDEPLNRVFQGFCEGGSEMSIGQFVQFAAEKKLIDKLLKATKCSIIFTKVKNRDKKKSTIDFEGFKVALQMMANIKGETYDHLVELCTGGMGAAADDAASNVELPIEDRLSSSGGEKLTVEEFDLLKVLGKGSFGKVMLVRKKGIEGIDGLFAMKTLRKAQLIKRKQLQHTHTERRIAQEFQNPFLVNLRFAFQSPDKLYLVLDYMGGGELFFWLRQHRRFSKGKHVAILGCCYEATHSDAWTRSCEALCCPDDAGIGMPSRRGYCVQGSQTGECSIRCNGQPQTHRFWACERECLGLWCSRRYEDFLWHSRVPRARSP